MWSKTGAITLIWLITWPVQAQEKSDTLVLDLQEVVTRVLSVSPELEAARAVRDAAEAQHRLARSSRFLTEGTVTSAFSAVPGITNPNGAPYDALYLDPDVRNDFSNLRPYVQTEVSILQPLHTWGSLKYSVRAADAAVDVESGAVHDKELTAALRGAELYYDLLLTTELYRLTGRVGDVVDQAMREIERLLQEGDPGVDDADRYQVLITQQEYRRRVVEVAENRKLAHSALERQLMLPEQTVILPANTTLTPLPFVPDSLAVYQVAALRYRPELTQARAGLVARGALVRVAQADYYPQIALAFMLSVSGASNRFRQPNPYVSDGYRRTSVRTGIGFRQKLNFLQTHTRVARAKAQQEEVRHMLSAAEQLVLFEVEQAWRNLEVEWAALAAQDSSLAISKEWLRVEYINFDLDLGDTENLVKAVQANLELEAKYFEAVRRYNVAVLRLLKAAGLLIRDVGDLIE